MSNARTLSWSVALRDLREDRSHRAEIREERLKTLSAQRGPLTLSAWRGRSGNRYVVGVTDLTVATAAEALPGALIAVRRDAAGVSGILDLYSGAAGEPDLAEWVARARAAGATELHAHGLAETAADRVAVVADLTAPLVRAA